MDLKDKRILYEIDLNARASYSEIGKKVGLSKETTNNRIKQLEKKGFISGYIPIINIAKLGYTGYAVFTQFQNIDEKTKKLIIAALVQNPAVYWVASLGGKYDLLFAIQAKNIIEFDRVYLEMQSKFSKYLKDSAIAIRISVTQFRRDYLLNKSSQTTPPYFGKNIEQEEIDRLDKQILSGISQNARIQTMEVAKKLGVARSTIQNRLKNLENKRIIQRYSALIHSERYGYQIYQLLITVHSKDEDTKKQLYYFSQSHPNITFFVDAVGRWDFEITCEVKNQEEIQKILSEIRNKFSNLISDIETVITFNYYIKYQLLP